MSEIPFFDLHLQNARIRDEIDGELRRVVESGAFTGGPFVEGFEREFADFCGTTCAVGVSSGTVALWMCLRCMNIGAGDEVITAPNSFIATAEAISLTGATPVFVDIDESACNMDPEQLESAIGRKTKAIVPVHLFGQMANMERIMEVARSHGLLVIEDACQAHGAEYRGRLAGSIGNAACFSFYPSKNLGAYGDAGAIVTNSADLADRLKVFRNHGQREKNRHGVIGSNERMDGLQGAVLSVKLRHLEAWNEARRENARTYDDHLRSVTDVQVPAEAEYAKHVYHIYAIRYRNRDGLIEALADKGVRCGVHYPVPIHLQEAYRSLRKGRGSFPVAEKIARELVSLPMFPELRAPQIERVCEEIKAFIDQRPHMDGHGRSSQAATR